MIGRKNMNFYIKMNEEKLAPSMVLYMRRTGAYGEENYVLMNNFKNWLNEHDLFCDNTVILAIPLDNPNITEARKCRYDVCMIDFTGGEICQDGVKCGQLAGGKYVTFLIEHTAKAVQRAWMECFGELQKYGYVPDTSRPIMERYAKKLVDANCCELCVPVLQRINSESCI